MQIEIDHLALWTADLDRSRRFYMTYFGATSNELYHNPRTNFKSYFLTFPGKKVRLEIMSRPNIAERPIQEDGREMYGLAHFAVTLHTEQAVNEMTERMRAEGVAVVGNPRRTGDGCYESVVLDPDGNRLELVA
ncbi:putative lactoylglutathione lyase [Paratrimastix pyriformis]|uniref:Lactoylglutathione lyase n=1 Tax=Paratrimastix pyriformis TaxID=342808 RepID=A0ABQ8UEX3_9EUKA|nr:putative lactoylglutathione lyase [Paratrimastix pyriformis]